MLAKYSSLSALVRGFSLMVNKHPLLMESGGFFYVLFFLTILSLLGISPSSSQQHNFYCNASVDCRVNASSLNVCCQNICRLHSDCVKSSSDTNSSSSNPNNFIKGNGNSNNMIRNNTRSIYSGQSNTTVDLNQSRLYDFCSKDSDCNSTHICISLDCLSTSSKETLKDCKSCESLDCKDGRCYNLTSTIVPTSKPTEGTITTLQLVLLFGSMGGIFIFIVIVYCVKTFTDNRRRQYLLKHGVWENQPSKDEKTDSEGKSDASRQQRKLEVPTITVETETDSKRKKKNKENLKDEITDTEGLEEFAVQQDKRYQKERRNVLSGCASKGCQTL